MKQTVCLLLLVVAGIVIGLSAQTDLSGPWEITLDTHVGQSTWHAVFEQDGNTLSGEIDIGDREKFPLKGKLEGDKIEFVFVMPDLDGDQPINLSGSVDPDSNTIAGDEGSFSWYGMGSWTAVKEAAEG